MYAGVSICKEIPKCMRSGNEMATFENEMGRVSGHVEQERQRISRCVRSPRGAGLSSTSLAIQIELAPQPDAQEQACNK